MTADYRLTPRAAQGFRRIAHYVEEHFGSAVALRVVDDLEHAFQLLAANPGMGHCEDLPRTRTFDSGALDRR